jgi:Fe-S cluster assembly protein SufD
VKVEKPLAIYHWLVNENASMFPHTLIIAEKGSSVTIFDHERSVKEVGGFSCAINDIFVGEDAKVTYVNSQNWSKQATSLKMSLSKVEARGYSKSLYLNLGGNYTRLENQVKMIGAESRSEMLGLAVADEKQEMDLRTLQTHVAPHTWSDLLYKNVLNDEAHTIFKGMIRVEEGAAQTDAYQTNRNLLLCGDAEADSMPGLEILNDDVKCSHGATTGQIEQELLYYLQQRGISKESAQFMLVHGFFEEVIDRVGNPEIVKELLAHVDAKWA